LIDYDASYKSSNDRDGRIGTLVRKVRALTGVLWTGIDRSLPVSIEVFGWRNAMALPRLLRVADHGDLGHSFVEYESQGAESIYMPWRSKSSRGTHQAKAWGALCIRINYILSATCRCDSAIAR